MTTAWVVLPTYNERENLATVVALTRAALAGCDPPVDGTVLVVDDGSPDGTGELADALAREHDDVRVLHRARKGGLGGAYLAGFDEALAEGADFVIEMDADLSHDPADLPRLIDAARDGADVVLGSRYVAGGGVEGWPLHRRLVSRAGGRYAAIVLGLPLSDLTGGFKCFRARALRALDRDLVRSRGYAFQVELTYHAARAGLEIAEIPIVFRERERGRSKMSPAIAFEAMWSVPLMRMRTLGAAAEQPPRGRPDDGAPDELDRGPRPRRRVRADGDRRRAARRRRAGDAVRRRARGGRDRRPPASVAAGGDRRRHARLPRRLARRLGDRPRRRPPAHRAPRPLAAPRAAALPPAERWFARYGSAFVLFGRLTPLVRSFVSIPAGALEYPFPRYVVLTALASLIWCAAFGIAGYALGKQLGQRPPRVPLRRLRRRRRARGGAVLLVRRRVVQVISYAQAVVLGLLQGAAELFPVSSLGHSVIVPWLLGWDIHQDDDSFLMFLVATHLATALVLLGFFRRLGADRARARPLDPRPWDRAGRPRRPPRLAADHRHDPGGTARAGVRARAARVFASPIAAAVFLFFNGLMLFAAERLRRGAPVRHDEHFSDERIVRELSPRRRRGSASPRRSRCCPASRARARRWPAACSPGCPTRTPHVSRSCSPRRSSAPPRCSSCPTCSGRRATACAARRWSARCAPPPPPICPCASCALLRDQPPHAVRVYCTVAGALFTIGIAAG